MIENFDVWPDNPPLLERQKGTSKMSLPFNKEYEHLYQTSIQLLDLSSEAIFSLQRAGILTIGECLDFYIQEKREGMDVNTNSFWGLEEIDLKQVYIKHHFYLYTEVRGKIRNMNYWHIVEDTN